MSVPLSHWKHLAWKRTVSAWNIEFLASPKALWTKRKDHYTAYEGKGKLKIICEAGKTFANSEQYASPAIVKKECNHPRNARQLAPSIFVKARMGLGQGRLKAWANWARA
ncbi:hypothetical protein TNCV_2794531 [Trichonephila clavipes]|nr:hypothetical protein TNCV_2794531 [Trichonephila clavipes]